MIQSDFLSELGAPCEPSRGVAVAPAPSPAPSFAAGAPAPAPKVVFVDSPDPPWSADPDDPHYNEADRLPEDWRSLVGRVFGTDRRTVGSLADVLDALPQKARDEWRALLEAESAAMDGDSLAWTRAWQASCAWQEKHGVECDAYGFNLRDLKTGEYLVEQW